MVGEFKAGQYSGDAAPLDDYHYEDDNTQTSDAY